MKLRIILFATLFVFSTLASPVVMAEDCNAIIKLFFTELDPDIAKTVNLDNHVDHRNFLAQLAKKNDIPVFLKQNGIGVDVPVILINTVTAKKLNGFLENSFGTQVALQQGSDNDHGMLRAGKFIIDMDTPGERGYGELEKTGLTWKNIDTYLPRRLKHGGFPTLEVAYLLTPNENNIIDYYQKVRRAAIFRIKFTFGDPDTQKYPNLLRKGGEHCFVFCKAQAVNTHATEIRKRLSALGVRNANELLEVPSIKQALKKVQTYFNNYKAGKLNSKMLRTPEFLDLFQKAYPVRSTKKQKQKILEWIVSLDASTRYGNLLSELGVSGTYGTEDAVSKRATAILVYDEQTNVNAFRNATYNYEGAFVSWPTTRQRPID